MRRILSFSLVSCLTLSVLVSGPAQAGKPKPWETRGNYNSMSLAEYKNSVAKKTVRVKIGKSKKKVACFPKQQSSGKRKWVPGVKLGTDTKNEFVYWASYQDQARHYKEQSQWGDAKSKESNKKAYKRYAKKAKSSSAESKACKKVAVLKLSKKNLSGLAKVNISSASTLSASALSKAKPQLFGTSTNLAGLNDNGVLVNALGSSSVNVQELIEAPDGSIYIIFTQKIDLLDPDGALYGWVDQKYACSFARAEPNSAKITCVDDEVDGVDATSVQFDNSGRVYYLSGGAQIRRANPSTSSITTMVRPTNGYISNFRVTGEGYLIVRGSSGNNSWVRAYSPDRKAKEIGSNTWGGLFDIFPDGNLYFNQDGEIYKFDADPDVLSVNPRSWIGYPWGGTNPVNESEVSHNIASASTFHRLPMGRLPVSDDRVYVTYGTWEGNRSVLKAAQVYPTLIEDLNVGLTQTQVIEPAGSNLALSGKKVTLVSGAQTTTTYRTVILNGANQTYRTASGLDGIEVFSMTYMKDSNEIFINGEILRTGVKVTGKYDVSSNSWTLISSDTGRIDDIELFSD